MHHHPIHFEVVEVFGRICFVWVVLFCNTRMSVTTQHNGTIFHYPLQSLSSALCLHSFFHLSAFIIKMHSLNALQKIKFIPTRLDDKEEKFRMRRQRLMDEENEWNERNEGTSNDALFAGWAWNSVDAVIVMQLLIFHSPKYDAFECIRDAFRLIQQQHFYEETRCQPL